MRSFWPKETANPLKRRYPKRSGNLRVLLKVSKWQPPNSSFCIQEVVLTVRRGAGPVVCWVSNGAFQPQIGLLLKNQPAFLLLSYRIGERIIILMTHTKVPQVSASPKRRKPISKAQPKPLPQKQKRRLGDSVALVENNPNKRIISYLSQVTKREELPYCHLVSPNTVCKMEIFKHIFTCFSGVTELKTTKEIADTDLQKMGFCLPTEISSHEKTLFLDLDETLIHTTFRPTPNNSAFVEVTNNGANHLVPFNVRPYCMQFLANLSRIYEIYIFTASESNYANALVQFLNRDHKTISGCLSRESCIKTSSGYYLKDLRLIKNRSLSQMILVDNLTMSFGGSLSNGIPILEFRSNEKDRELCSLEGDLVEMRNCEDVREVIKLKWKLGEITELESLFRTILSN